jgi:IS1 family transposase
VFRNLECKRVQVDETWGFVGAKAKNADPKKRETSEQGDAWLWVATDADTKLVPCWFVGPRYLKSCFHFLIDLSERVEGRFQLSTDGFKPYRDAVAAVFNREIDYAMVIKAFGKVPDGSGSVFELLKTPQLRDWLEEDWGRANLAVEEFLRFVSPVQFSKPRYVREDVTLDGVELKKGDKIMVMIAAANMDPKANDAPEKLDLERHPNRHIAFGTGIHFCLGYQLARLEGKCALKALFGRWPKLALAIDPATVRWRKHPGLKAIETLPVRPEAA